MKPRRSYEKINRCRILKTKNKKTIKLTEIGNFTYADLENKIYKLPYNLDRVIKFLQVIGII